MWLAIHVRADPRRPAKTFQFRINVSTCPLWSNLNNLNHYCLHTTTSQSSFKVPRQLRPLLYSLVGNSVHGAVRLRLFLLLSFQQFLAF